MHFLIRETLSFNLIYVAACYLVGTGMCHNMVVPLQHYNLEIIERLVFNLVLNFERLCFVYIFTPVLSHGSCA